MKGLAHISIYFLLSYGIVFGLFDLSHYLQEKQFFSRLNNDRNAILDVQPDLGSDDDNLTSLSARGYRTLASLFYRETQQERSVENRLKRLCQMKWALERSLEKDPLHALSALGWAEYSLLLEQDVCGLPSGSDVTPEILQEVFSYLRQQHPHNPKILFAIGKSAARHAFSEEAMKSFSAYVRLKPSPSRGEREFFSRWLLDSHRIKTVLPEQLPIALIWSDEVVKKMDQDVGMLSLEQRSEIRKALKEKQMRALQAKEVSFRNGFVPSDIYFHQLVRLGQQAIDDQVRQAADSYLSSLPDLSKRLQQNERQMIAKRANMQLLDVVPGYVTYDFSPDRSQLGDWLSQEFFALDQNRNSLGFFLGDGQAVKMIQIASQENVPQKYRDSLTVFTSNDNFNWTRASTSLVSKATPISIKEEHSMVFFLDEPRSARFWKVHYRVKDSEKRMIDRFDRLLKVYGARRGANS